MGGRNVLVGGRACGVRIGGVQGRLGLHVDDLSRASGRRRERHLLLRLLAGTRRRALDTRT